MFSRLLSFFNNSSSSQSTAVKPLLSGQGIRYTTFSTLSVQQVRRNNLPSVEASQFKSSVEYWLTEIKGNPIAQLLLLSNVANEGLQRLASLKGNFSEPDVDRIINQQSTTQKAVRPIDALDWYRKKIIKSNDDLKTFLNQTAHSPTLKMT